QTQERQDRAARDSAPPNSPLSLLSSASFGVGANTAPPTGARARRVPRSRVLPGVAGNSESGHRSRRVALPDFGRLSSITSNTNTRFLHTNEASRAFVACGAPTMAQKTAFLHVNAASIALGCRWH